VRACVRASARATPIRVHESLTGRLRQTRPYPFTIAIQHSTTQHIHAHHADTHFNPWAHDPLLSLRVHSLAPTRNACFLLFFGLASVLLSFPTRCCSLLLFLCRHDFIFFHKPFFLSAPTVSHPSLPQTPFLPRPALVSRAERERERGGGLE